MLSGQVARPAIVHADGIHRRLLGLGGGDHIESDYRKATRCEVRKMVEVERRRPCDHAPDAKIEEIFCVLPLARWITQAVPEYHLEAPRLGGDFHGASHTRVEGIRDRGNDQSNDRTEPGFQLSGRPAWPIAELFDGLFDPLHCFRSHPIGTAIEQVRYRTDRSACQGGDLLYSWANYQELALAFRHSTSDHFIGASANCDRSTFPPPQ